MARPLNEIVAHIRMVVANPAVSTTLVQTEDLEVLCDAATESERLQDDSRMLRLCEGDRKEMVDEIERLRAVICDALDDEVARRMMSKWCAEAIAAIGYDPALKDTTP